MESITPPPSSQINDSITEPQLQLESPAWFALAVKLLQTKPSSLSISEYIILLRSSITPGGRSLSSTSERHHLDACEFWRKRSEAEAAKAVELQARVNELIEINNAQCQIREGLKAVNQSQNEGSAKKKAKTTIRKGEAGKDMKQTANHLGGQKMLHQHATVVVIEKAFLLFSGSSISDLISSLRLLQFAREPHLVSKTITQSSKVLQKVMQDFINGNILTCMPPIHPMKAREAQAKRSQEVSNFSRVVEKSCERILSALSALVVGSQEEGNDQKGALKNNGFIADGICAVIQSMTGIISLIQENSRLLLYESFFPQPQISTGASPMKDIRLELTMILIRQLTSLRSEITYQRSILEGTFYSILEIIGRVLSHSFINATKKDENIALLALAVEDTSWYLLRILEAILPCVSSAFDAGDSKLEHKARQRLGCVLMDGLFGNRGGGETGVTGTKKRKGNNDHSPFWEGLEESRFDGAIPVIDSPFSRALWEILGLDVMGIGS